MLETAMVTQEQIGKKKKTESKNGEKPVYGYFEQQTDEITHEMT